MAGQGVQGRQQQGGQGARRGGATHRHLEHSRSWRATTAFTSVCLWGLRQQHAGQLLVVASQVAHVPQTS
jgi:hypothetical protein